MNINNDSQYGELINVLTEALCLIKFRIFNTRNNTANNKFYYD